MITAPGKVDAAIASPPTAVSSEHDEQALDPDNAASTSGSEVHLHVGKTCNFPNIRKLTHELVYRLSNQESGNSSGSHLVFRILYFSDETAANRKIDTELADKRGTQGQ